MCEGPVKIKVSIVIWQSISDKDGIFTPLTRRIECVARRVKFHSKYHSYSLYFNVSIYIIELRDNIIQIIGVVATIKKY